MDFLLPQIGEGIYEAELVRWLVEPGDSVRPGRSVAEVLTDKATSEIPAPFAGQISELFITPGNRVRVGEKILTYAEAGDPVPIPAAIPTAPPPIMVSVPPPSPMPKNGQTTISSRLPAAAPSVRHLARKLGIDLAQITGTGPAGRILLDDLSRFLGAREKPEPETRPPDQDFGKPGTRMKLLGLRRRIAQKMAESVKKIPHVSCIEECDVTELVRLRDSLKTPCAKKGLKLTYLPFILRAVALALRDVPIMNSTYDDAAEEIMIHEGVHLGVAVAAPQGLLVPVLRDADRKDVFRIAAEVDQLATDARTGRAKMEDLRGSTFSVTSIGNVGGLISTPIINYPESGILGIGRIVKRPVFDDAGNVKPARMVYLSLSFDHRTMDGVAGASFLMSIMKHLANPAALLVPDRFA